MDLCRYNPRFLLRVTSEAKSVFIGIEQPEQRGKRLLDMAGFTVQRTGNTHAACMQHVCSVHVHAFSMRAKYWQRTCNIHATHTQHTCNMHAARVRHAIENPCSIHAACMGHATYIVSSNEQGAVGL